MSQLKSGEQRIARELRNLVVNYRVASQLGCCPHGISRGQTTQPEVPTITSETSEVSLDIVVRDRKGRAITDLKSDDLVVTDAGSVVKLSDLRLVNGDAGGDRLVTLVFDRMEPSAAENAREIALKILKLAPAHQLQLAVLQVNGRLRLVQAFTGDRAALKEAVRVVTSGYRKGEPHDASDKAEKRILEEAQTRTGATPPDPAARMLLAALEDSQRNMLDQHTKPTLASLLALARAQRDLPRRKTVIFFAQGQNFDAYSKDFVRTISGAANRAGVSFYCVDANALDPKVSAGLATSLALGRASGGGLNASPVGSRTQTIGNTSGLGTGSVANEQATRIYANGLSPEQSPLSALAANTGGVYISGSENVRKPISRLFEDLTTYYQATYVPKNDQYDGSFRPVSVKPVRKNLVVQSRSGYFALPPDAGSAIRPFEASMLRVLRGPELPSALDFRVTVLHLGQLPDGVTNELVMDVPLFDIDLAEDANTGVFSGHLCLLAQVRDQSGKVIAHFSEEVPRHGALEQKETVRAETVSMQRHFVAAPGQYILEAVVLDRNANKFGAVRRPLELPENTAGPSLSDIALVRRTEPYNSEIDPLEPMRFETQRIVPNVTQQTPAGTKDVSLFFILHPKMNASGPMRLELEVMKDGEPVTRMPVRLRQPEAKSAVPYLASLRGASLPPGHYQIVAILTQDGQTAEQAASFTLGNPPPAAAGSRGSGEAASADERSKMKAELVIGPAPAGTAPLSPDEQRALLNTARQRALSFQELLPNFMCVQITDRSVDALGTGDWRHKDSFAELLRYRDKTEHRVMLELNGKKTQLDRSDLKGTMSHGEFGGLLNAIFRPETKAKIAWAETALLGDSLTQVFDYRVAKENSTFGVSDAGEGVLGFHGKLYIDNATHSIRRVTLEADGLQTEAHPVHSTSMHSTSVRSTSMAVDYDFVDIGTHEYLMPVSASVTVGQGRHTVISNAIEFRDYKRYGAESTFIVQ